MRNRLAVALAAAVGLAAGAQPAAAMVDRAGTTIPNTGTTGTAAQLAGGPTVTKKLFTPESPGDDDPGVLSTLGSSATPEDDLGAALDALRDASSASDAQDARRRALDILEGNPLSDRTYSGMPLLNWDAPRKVKDVSPGGEVRVREVRYGDTVLSDTWLLRFADPAQPFTISYEIADLGPRSAGELAPTPLLSDSGGPLGGLHAVLQPLSLAPQPTGTSATSRFTDTLGVTSGGKEQTRQGVQKITVRMPPPRYVDAILDPDLTAHGDPMSAGGNPLTALRPYSAAAAGAAEHDFGFTGDSPSDAERAAAIAKIGVRAPERQLYEDLQALDAGDLDAAHTLGAGDRGLVTAMRSHTELPAGFGGDPAADASLVLLNGETYRSADRVRVAPGGALKVSVTNGDEFPRTITASQLFARQAVLGAIDWGRFDHAPIGLGAGATLAPGESHTFTVTPEGDAFEIILGDAEHGDHATWALALDRGPLKQSLEFPDNATAPLHITQGPDGAMWMTLSGIDQIGRLKAGSAMSVDNVEKFRIPGGNFNADPALFGLGPHALRFDANGILWATLDVGNGIARIDPSKVKDGTEDGIRVYHLNDCTAAICPPPFPPEPGLTPPPTRLPVQMQLEQDGNGNTVLVFAEENASAIGVARFAPDGTMLDTKDFSCSCRVPLGVDLGPDGSAWFTEAVENRVGHLRFDQAEPMKTSAAHLEHHAIPSGISVVDPVLVPGGKPFFSSAPHSLAVDRHGKVWFSEEATSKVGRLDPDKATPGTTAGITEFTLQRNDFGRDPAPADITIDRRDTVYWTDEYGDAVGALASDGAQHLYRPSERNSLTDSPATDSDGNLWFLEGGANLLTRISGITAGTPRPDAPPTFTVQTATGVVSGAGVKGIDAVTLQVVRNGTVVAERAGVQPQSGAFATDLGARAGDTVRIVAQGNDAPGAFSFTVATLDSTRAGDGAVTGSATRGGRAVADRVTISGREAPIDAANGAFSLSGVAAGGTVTWAEGTRAGVFRTVSPVGTPAGTDTPRGDDAGRSETAPKGTTPKDKKAPDACRDRLWLTRSGTSRRVPLLGASAANVRSCLGAPTARSTKGTEQRWRYGRGLELRLRAGKVTRMILAAKGFRSLPDGLAVGSKADVLRTAFGAPAAAAGRALVRRADGRYADIRVTLRRGKVNRITVDLRTFSALDPSGRKLAKGTG